MKITFCIYIEKNCIEQCNDTCFIQNYILKKGDVNVVDNRIDLLKLNNIDILIVCKAKNEIICDIIDKFKKKNKTSKVISIIDESIDLFCVNNIISRSCDVLVRINNKNWKNEVINHIKNFISLIKIDYELKRYISTDRRKSYSNITNYKRRKIDYTTPSLTYA